MTIMSTQRLLVAGTLLAVAATAGATPALPEHLAKTQRQETRAKFKSAPRATRSAGDCAVLIQLPEDLQGWNPDICVACAPGEALINPDGDYLYLLPGTYDIVARFIHSNFQSFTFNDYQGYVVLENVEVKNDMSVMVDPATITNVIEFKPILPDGREMELPVINLDESGNEIPVSEGSMPFSGLTLVDFIVGPGWGIDSSNTMSAVINAETPWGFYDPTRMFGVRINDVSERIHVGISTWVGTPEYDQARTIIMLAEQAGSDPGVISNSVKDYKIRNFTPEWTPTGSATIDLIEKYPTELGHVNPFGYAIHRVAGDTNRLTSGFIMTESKSSDIYNMAFSRNQVENPQVHIIVAPMKTELVQAGSDVSQSVNFGAWLEPFNDGEWIVYPQTTLATTSESPTADFPFFGVEAFRTYTKDNEDKVFGTAPLLTTNLKRGFNQFTNEEHLGFDITSTGRLGEIRNSDLAVIGAEMRVNGVKVANSLEAMNEWWAGFESDMAGSMEVKLNVSNFEADNRRASTVSTTRFDMDQTDCYPPTVTMLQVRDHEGRLTSRLDPAKSNTVLIAAGDFEAGKEAVTPYGETAMKTYEPASFSIWYAAAGTEEWTELDCNKLNEEVIPGIGIIYEAVMSTDETGWKDLKTVVEDASGNRQEQTVGMAFYISNESGVQDVEVDAEVRVYGNMIFAPKGAGIYRIDGVKTDSNELQSGVYIVRTESRTYKIHIK